MDPLRPRLAATEHGAGQPLVLLHAFPLDGRMWRAQQAALSSRFRVVTPDLGGFGASLGLPPVLDVEQHARDVLALLDHLGLQHAWVGGLSMGGYVALAMAALAPRRVERLLLLDTRAGADGPEARAGRAASQKTVAEQGVPTLVNGMLPRLLGPACPPRTVEEVRQLCNSQTVEGVSAALAMLRDRPDRAALLPTLAMPTRVVVGERDVLTPPAEARAMAEAIPHATLHVIPGAGHLSNLEQPDAFNRILLEWA